MAYKPRLLTLAWAAMDNLASHFARHLGKLSAAALSPEQRRIRASKAASARWKRHKPAEQTASIPAAHTADPTPENIRLAVAILRNALARKPHTTIQRSIDAICNHMGITTL